MIVDLWSGGVPAAILGTGVSTRWSTWLQMWAGMNSPPPGRCCRLGGRWLWFPNSKCLPSQWKLLIFEVEGTPCIFAAIPHLWVCFGWMERVIGGRKWWSRGHWCDPRVGRSRGCNWEGFPCNWIRFEWQQEVLNRIYFLSSRIAGRTVQPRQNLVPPAADRR